MLEVRADVYNLAMPSTIKHEKLTINRLPNYGEIMGTFNNLDEPTATAEAIITMPEEISNADDAIKEAEKYLEPYRRLLSFAQDHDVFFWGFRCYEKINDTEKLLSTSMSAIRTGSPRGGSYIRSLEEFLRIAVPLLRDENYNEKTGLEHALITYNEGSSYPLTIEVELALFFSGLETLANANWSNLPKTDSKPWLFDQAVWSSISKSVKKSVDDLEVKEPNRSKFLGRFGHLKEPPVEEKIRLLCQSQGLPDYSREIAAMNDMRNEFLHGRPTQAHYRGIEAGLVSMCAQRLLFKLLLKLLNFYLDWPRVHGAVVNPDLLAVQ